MRIDIVSDVVCPWCFVGKRRFERAIQALPAGTVHVTWRPFRLNPEMPPEGMDRAAYLKAKFGDRGGSLHTQIENVGRSEGIDFAFDRITRAPNTLNAHRLIRHALASGQQTAMVEALFQAYFLDGKDVGDIDTLANIAQSAGLDAAGAAAYLASDEDREAVEEEDALARRIGINGVPCFMFEQKYAISGAQMPEAFHQVFAKLAEEAAAE